MPPVFRRILVATDGSDRAARAVERAVELAAATGAAVTVLSAADTLERAHAVAEEAAAAHAGAGVPIEVAAADTDPVTAIIDAATAGGHDLIVTGNRGMRGLRRFLGSVPNTVSHHLPCSLLIVRTG